MQQVYENNRTLVPYHEQFFYTQTRHLQPIDQDTSGGQAKQSTANSHFHASVVTAVCSHTQCQEQETSVKVFFFVTTGSHFAPSPLGLQFVKALLRFQVCTLKLQVFFSASLMLCSG